MQQFFRITGTDQSQKEVEAQGIQDVLRTVDHETTESIEQLDPDSGEIFGSIHKDGRVWLNPATKEIRLTNCDVSIPVPIEYYGLLSRFDWFVDEGAVVAVINRDLVQMMELVQNPWLANPLA